MAWTGSAGARRGGARFAGRNSARGEGAAAALGLYLGGFIAVGACFAFGLYTLLEPTRYDNPGLRAYKPPPAAVVTYYETAPHENVAPPAPVVVDSPAGDAKAAAASEPAPAEEKPVEVKPEPAKKAAPRVVRRERRNPYDAYAQQPFFAPRWSGGGFFGGRWF
jgi:hypothetical protein